MLKNKNVKRVELKSLKGQIYCSALLNNLEAEMYCSALLKTIEAEM